MKRIENDKETIEEYVEVHTRDLFEWLRQYLFFYGYYRGYQDHEEKNRYGFGDRSDLEATWYSGKHKFTVYLRDERVNRFINTSWRANEYSIPSDYYDGEEMAIVQIANTVERGIRMFFGGVKQINTVGFCQSPFHKQRYEGEMRPVVCEFFGDKILCHSCKDTLALPAPSPASVTDDRPSFREERKKMTDSLRFSILTRDGFACKICGRSPMKGDQIKLHVDHIHPVSKGGKTVPENLQTLCEECNMGKRDKVISQLAIGL